MPFDEHQQPPAGGGGDPHDDKAIADTIRAGMMALALAGHERGVCPECVTARAVMHLIEALDKMLVVRAARGPDGAGYAAAYRETFGEALLRYHEVIMKAPETEEDKANG